MPDTPNEREPGLPDYKVYRSHKRPLSRFFSRLRAARPDQPLNSGKPKHRRARRFSWKRVLAWTAVAIGAWLALSLVLFFISAHQSTTRVPESAKQALSGGDHILLTVAAHGPGIPEADRSRAVERIGWPEARIPLAQAVIYVANAPKSNATVKAIDAALGADDEPIPDALRDSNTSTAKKAGRGAGYHYSHSDYDQAQAFLPDKLRGAAFYEPLRPQERSWRDKDEPATDELEALWSGWIAAHPDGGEVPMDDWCVQLGCSKEALARAVQRLASGGFRVERSLKVARS